jgi:hypothetical protein
MESVTPEQLQSQNAPTLTLPRSTEGGEIARSTGGGEEVRTTRGGKNRADAHAAVGETFETKCGARTEKRRPAPRERVAQTAQPARASAAEEVGSVARLSPQQLYAIDLILIGEDDDDIAGKVGVSRTTIWRWKNFYPAFAERLNQRQVEIWGQAGDRLRAALDEAVGELIAQLRDGEAWERFRAARTLLVMANAKRFFQPAPEQTRPQSESEEMATKNA